MGLRLVGRRASGRVGSAWRVAIVAFIVFVVFPVVGSGSGTAHAATCAAPLTRVACENQLPGDPTSDWFVNGAGDPSIQGFATSMSVNAGLDGVVQDQYAVDGVSPRHPADRLLPGQRRPQDRVAHGAHASRCRRPSPRASSDASTGSRRLRQLGRVRVVDGAGRRGFGRLRRAPGTRRRDQRRKPDRVRGAQRQHRFRHRVPDVGHDVGRRTTPTAATACTSRRPGRDAAYKVVVQPSVRQRERHGARLLLRRRIPAGPVHGVERLRRLVHLRRRCRPERVDIAQPSQVFMSRRVTTSTGRARSAPTSKRRATPA